MDQPAQILNFTGPLKLEGGDSLTDVQIAYHTYGQLNAQRDNVIWIAHALTGNSEALDWWSGLIGEGRLFDPADYFMVCANMLGSCYGTTGPASTNPKTGNPYGKDFPLVTVRDMVKLHQHLRDHLGIQRIHLAIGGSMGGQQVLEWAVLEPGAFRHLAVLASNAKHSPWGVAFNESQRMALEADQTLWDTNYPEAGARGLEAARSIGILSYRHYQAFHLTQSEDEGAAVLDHFRASSYQRYQGQKLRKRFNPWSYWTLSKAMDSHDVGRDRGGVAAALGRVRAKTLVVGITTDLLFPPEEQALIAQYVPGARFRVIDSHFGHDGFLVEFEQMEKLLGAFLANEPLPGPKDLVPYAYPGRLAVQQGRKPALPGTETF
ncbi:MAG: homoserine O-acetyltransferase [Lewinellaceae bacterium]|nr:homoserine O-acetyltransferase [Lewinellaceae bacterium]